ncbi:MAG TPA: helix-turn-helix transcriptional regulator [Solirubrobacterales bacterium]|nr:helix-turn-helix transcriptional regulator [Solirubrobacterales bacterium]
MAELSTDELRQALEFVRQVQAAPDLDAYSRAVLRIRELVPCDLIAYQEVDIATGETFGAYDPEEQAFPGIEEVFARYAHEHPVIRHHQGSDGSPTAISDLISAEELHGLDLYREVFARVGAEDQLSFALPSPPEKAIGVAMNRGQRGFSDRDRELIELVRPHLIQAFLDVRLREGLDPLGEPNLRALGLTRREAEVARLLVDGRSAAQLASELTISVHTARNHVASIYTKLRVRTRAGAVATILRGERDEP